MKKTIALLTSATILGCSLLAVSLPAQAGKSAAQHAADNKKDRAQRAQAAEQKKQTAEMKKQTKIMKDNSKK